MIKLKIKYGNSQTDLRFPCTEKEMNAALERIHAEDVTPLELYVSEVVFPEELGCLQDRFVNLDEVNFLGKRMDSFFGDEEYQFYEAMKLEGFDTLPDLINANMLTLVIGAASEDIKEELEQNILYDQYDSMDEVINAVRQMTQDAGPVKAVFFCPLVGNIDEGMTKIENMLEKVIAAFQQQFLLMPRSGRRPQPNRNESADT